MNCFIDVSKKVFTPRMETEFWVKKAIKEIKNHKKLINILDIFAGSGCIGIAVLKVCPEICRRVDFVDIDKEAIEQIKINLKLNEISEKRYKIYKSDLFEKIRNKQYDLIFANPPYVAINRINEIQKEVLEKEPHCALFGGKDGMSFIRKFLNGVKKHLKPDGKIFMEFDPLQKDKIEEALTKLKFNFILKKDQFNKFRWLEAWEKIK